ncbi:MAG: response regulator [Anaerolineae bacterium]|nr:response regulator [Anaerolineae bacterium]
MDKPIALVVEDEYDISLIFARALQSAGYETEIVRSGDTALTWLRAATPNLVILDLQLPRVPGTQILHYIRSDPRLTDIRVIVATAHPNIAAALQDRADWILIKPVNFGQLRDLAKRFSPTKPGGDNDQ